MYVHIYFTIKTLSSKESGKSAIQITARWMFKYPAHCSNLCFDIGKKASGGEILKWYGIIHLVCTQTFLQN